MACNSFLSLLKKTMASSRVKIARISRQYGFGDNDFRFIRLFTLSGGIPVKLITKIVITG
jgi:hypothetical protein